MRRLVKSLSTQKAVNTFRDLQNFANTGWIEEGHDVRLLLEESGLRNLVNDVHSFYLILCQRLAKEFVEGFDNV